MKERMGWIFAGIIWGIIVWTITFGVSSFLAWSLPTGKDLDEAIIILRVLILIGAFVGIIRPKDGFPALF